MPNIVDLLGEQVLCKNDDLVSTASFAEESKIIGLYFSAHWCPPCKMFTPKLVEWYNKFKGTEKGKKLEIVFVSSDRDEDSFNEYYGEMPWHALPLAHRDRKVGTVLVFGYYLSNCQYLAQGSSVGYYEPWCVLTLTM